MESKEIVELLLNIKKFKNIDSSEVPAISIQINLNFCYEVAVVLKMMQNLT